MYKISVFRDQLHPEVKTSSDKNALQEGKEEGTHKNPIPSIINDCTTANFEHALAHSVWTKAQKES